MIISKTSQSPIIWVLILTVILLFLNAIQDLTRLLRGKVLTFDGVRGVFLIGNSAVVSFGEIQRAEIKYNGQRHRLSIVLKNGKAIHIAKGGEDTISELAKEIAGMIKVEVTEKEGFFFDSESV